MTYLKIVLNILLVVITCWIPKSKKYVIVGGWKGQRYADNSKAMYELLLEKKEELGIKKVFWYTNNKEIYSELKKRGDDVLFGISIKSIWWHLRSKVHFIDQCTKDIINVLSIRCIRVNLWHGIPIKKIGSYLQNKENEKESKKTALIRKLSSGGFWNDQYLLVTSEWARDILAKGMKLDNEKCLVSSYPRNRRLYEVTDLKKGKRESFLVFYLPTFRDNLEVNPISKLNLNELNKVLNEYNIRLLIKPHFENKADYDMFENLNNVKILDSKEDVYEYLHKADLLVTDYSSVYYDFLLTNRPVLFFPYDIEYYKQEERGFIVPYDEHTPGQKVYQVDELLDTIIYIREHTEEYCKMYKKEYEEIKELVNKYTQEIDYTELFKIWTDKNFR